MGLLGSLEGLAPSGAWIRYMAQAIGSPWVMSFNCPTVIQGRFGHMALHGPGMRRRGPVRCFNPSAQKRCSRIPACALSASELCPVGFPLASLMEPPECNRNVKTGLKQYQQRQEGQVEGSDQSITKGELYGIRSKYLSPVISVPFRTSLPLPQRL